MLRNIYFKHQLSTKSNFVLKQIFAAVIFVFSLKAGANNSLGVLNPKAFMSSENFVMYKEVLLLKNHSKFSSFEDIEKIIANQKGNVKSNISGASIDFVTNNSVLLNRLDYYNKGSKGFLDFKESFLSTVDLLPIVGKVLDKNGNPLIGVTILIKDSNVGAITDLDGNFNIECDLGTTLIFSYTGYATQEVVVSNSGINITLEESATLINEVVVVGYGTQRKSDLTGAVSSITTKDIANIPSSRVDQLLQGRSAGVQITSSSGAPGAGTVIRIRGGNSIVGDNEPLWVIDGIIVGQDFDLNNINTNDIKSIEVLKDASSVAIYGSRGANGVILVTTKSGIKTDGKPEITAGISSGIQSVTKHPAYLTSAQHAIYANEDARFRKTSEPFPNLSIVPETDWIGMLISPANITNADLSINGSSSNGNINYYISGNYFNQGGVIKNSGLSRFIYRSNVDIQLSDKFKTGFRLNMSRLNTDNGTVNYQTILTMLRERAVTDEKGNYTGVDPITNSVAANPVANANLNTNESITNNILATLYLEYKLSSKWMIRSTFNPEINTRKTNIFRSSQSPEFLAVGDKGNATINNISGLGWNNENIVQFTSDFGKNHNLSVLGGFSAQQFKQESTSLSAFGITTDATQFNNLSLSSDPSRNIVGSGYDAFQLISYFGRVNYSYNNKYLLTLVGRSDGSSRFAPGNKYAFFPSAAVAWKLGEESFIKDLNIFSDLKLRASYGKAGSQAIDSYRTLAVVEDAKTSYNGVLTGGTTLGRPSNEKLKWETTKQLDLALEASFWSGRLNLELDYYDKTTSDLLLEVQIPKVTGFVNQLQNLGKIRNRGLELMVNTVNVSKKDFKWSSTITISGNRNKVLDLGGVDYIDLPIARNTNISGQGGARLVVGQPGPVFTGVNYLGTWKNQEDITNSKQLNQVVGGPHFDDPNGNGQISSTEYYTLGSPQADFIYGLQNNFRYKGFDLSVFIQGTQGNEVFNSLTATGVFTRGEFSKYVEVLDRWTPTNNTSEIPGVGYLGTIVPNSYMVEDGSHLRIKTLRLGYTFSVPKWNFKNVNFYLAGNNLLLFSNFRLIDPETSQVNKNEPNGNVLQGFASAEYPAARIITFGFNATF